MGHGVLGRLPARLVVARGGAPPVVWETNPSRMGGALGYEVVHPDNDKRRDYRWVCDTSGDPGSLKAGGAAGARRRDRAGGLLRSAPLGLHFRRPSCARHVRVAAQWKPDDLVAVRQLIGTGRLSLDGLITHPPSHASRSRLSHRLRRSRLPENDPRLESLLMNAPFDAASSGCARRLRSSRMRPEAAGEKGDADHRDLRQGRIGKSFTLANLSYMMAQQGKRVLLIGCDPKSDTTSLLFGGRSCPTIIETSSKKKLAGEAVKIGDVCFKRDGVFAMELGGPEVGRGCGGRGIIHGFELLEKLGFHEWGFDYVLLDFLGDVVCGGFGLPIARDMCQKVIVVGSNDLQSLYVANNVCSAVDYFRKLGGNVGVAGMVINKDDGTGEAAGLRRGGRHSGAGRHSGRRRYPPQERELRNHRQARRAMGAGVRTACRTGGAGPARPSVAVDPGRPAGLVRRRRGRSGCGPGPGDAGGYVRCDAAGKAVARSHL